MTTDRIPLRKRLSSKIFISILVGALVSIAAIGLFAFMFTEAALQRSVANQQIELARQTLNTIDRMLYERITDIQQISGEEAIGHFLVELNKANVAPNTLLQKNLLKRMNELTVVTGPWDVLFVVDYKGKIVLSASEPLLGNSIENYPVKLIAYNVAIQGDDYYSDLVVSKDTGLPSIIFSVPVRDNTRPTKPIVGVVVGNFSWPAVMEILSEVPTAVFLLNQEGRIIGDEQAMSDPERIVDSLKKGAVFSQFIVEKQRSFIVAKGRGILPEEALASVVVQSGYLSYRGSAWRLLLETPVAEAFAPASETAAKLVLLLLPIIVATPAAILFIIGRLVIRPIGNLNRAIQAITSGDLTQQAPIRSGDEIGALAVSFNTMTSRLRESHETLEKKVKQRTAELSESNESLKKEIDERKRLENIVLQSEKMAAVGQLAGGVAHEINNPLGVILGFTQGLVRRLQPGDPYDMPLRSIERESMRCKNLVQDLLTFSRTSRTDKEEMDLNEAIQSSLSLVSAQAKVKNVSLVKDFGTDLPAVMANKNQIQQVLVNLCNNAMDAMPDGGTLTVHTGKSSRNGQGAVEIRVKDTGQGIPKEILSKIFEPFFTTKEVGKGTGLGLSLVYEIIQKHEGLISVDSQISKGTVFSVVLPVKPGAP